MLNITMSRRWHSDAAQSVCAEVGTDDPVAAIEVLAAQLVEDSGLARPFRNLKRMASHQDIFDIEVIPMSDAGRLIGTAKGLLVQVNAAHPETKRRFTTCHEIGHTLFPSYDPHRPSRVDHDTGLYAEDDEEEFLCDVAAAELLMPTAEFRRELAWHKLHVWSIDKLAKEFGASLEATAIKCVRVASEPVALIVWDSAMASTSGSARGTMPPELRVRYAIYGSGFGSYRFAHGSAALPASLAVAAYQVEGTKNDRELLVTAHGPVTFLTESLAFPYIVGNAWHKKVLTFVFGH